MNEIFQKMKDIFRPKKPFGLDISDFSIEIISLSGSIENPRLLALGRKELPSGIFEDGKILNKKDLEKFLRDLIESPKFGKITTKKFIFSLPESKSFIHFFEIPKDLKKDKTLEFIKSEASQTLPFSLAELFFDFQIRNSKVLLVAARKNIVNDYLELFKNLEIIPIALEIESLSLARALIEEKDYHPPATLPPSAGPLILIVDIGAKTTNFSLFDEKGLRLSISNPIAGNKFTQAISEKLKISPFEAEKLKREIGLNPERKEGRVFLILQEEIQELIKEIREIEDYFQEKTGLQPTQGRELPRSGKLSRPDHPPALQTPKIEKIILTGGGANLPYLSKYLFENLEKKVEIADPWIKIKIDKEALKIEPIFYSTAIGAALRGLEKDPKRSGINLIKDIKY